MSSRKRATLEMGHDAFLDIVANLVGILIILVVILGTQSQSAIKEVQEAKKEDALSTDAQMEQLATYSMQAASAQSDSNRFESRIKQLDSQLEKRNRQRGTLMDLLSEGEDAWHQMQKELDEQAVNTASQHAELSEAKATLATLRGQRAMLENKDAPVVAIAHLPTPMAKTVFGEEIHLRLMNNRLSVVPIKQLIKEIRRDFSRMAAGGRSGQMESAVGPVRGFVAKYIMQKSRERVAQGGSIGMATRVELRRMMVQPLSEPHGHPIEEVLANSQILDVELAGRNPATTTITVWVYPDSFGAFRTLKEHLYRKGYATAARPLPEGRPIVGGPGGSRSNAQ